MRIWLYSVSLVCKSRQCRVWSLSLIKGLFTLLDYLILELEKELARGTLDQGKSRENADMRLPHLRSYDLEKKGYVDNEIPYDQKFVHTTVRARFRLEGRSHTTSYN